MKILNFGSCNIDYVYLLDHIVKEGETETGESLEIFPGGKGLNQSVAASRAGGKVYHAGYIGEDGDFLKEILSDSGVDTSFLKKTCVKNGHAIIQVGSKGENSIFLYPGSNRVLTKEYIDFVLGHFEQEDFVLLQNETNLVPHIIEKACEKGMKVIFNPSPIDENIKKVDFRKISYLILNEIEAREISSCSQPKEALAYFREKYPSLSVVLTLGEKGCVFMDKEGEISHSAFSVKVVDTTGAGDTFTGYFIALLCAGEKMESVLKKASAASAIAVSRKGASPSIPLADEVNFALKKFENEGFLI